MKDLHGIKSRAHSFSTKLRMPINCVSLCKHSASCSGKILSKKKKQTNSQLAQHTLNDQIAFWQLLDQWTLWCEFSANATKISQLQLYFYQIVHQRTIFTWLEQCCNSWSSRTGDRTNSLHHSATKNMTFGPVSIGQLTCLHYRPGQQWDGAEPPTASSHLQLQHNQREHCSDAWQAAWPSPGTDHLQHKTLSSFGCFPRNITFFWQAFVLPKKSKVQTTKHYSLSHWDRLLITPER